MRSGTASFQARLFWAFALVTIIAIMLPAYFFRNSLYQDSVDAAGKDALARAALVKGVLESGQSEEQLRRLFAASEGRHFRMTLMDRDGAVTHDSMVGEGSLSQLDNHSDRPEIEAARAEGEGLSLRFSNTLDHEAVYAAVRLENGGVLRVAVPLADIRRSFERRLPHLFTALAGVTLACLFLSALITGKVRKHMDAITEIVTSIAGNSGKSRRLHGVRWREMLPLAGAVNHMADTIEEHVAEITDKQGQLETILDSMHEGVLVLGPGGGIRRWNKALAGIFPEIAQAEGRPVIEVLPLPGLQRRVDALLAEEEAQSLPEEGIHFEMPAGRFLVARVSRPVTRNDSLGAVIVVHDVTEIMRLERVRRDFVSNVSHELRTPLTSIAGYAETLASVDDLDVEYKKFAGIIHKHAVSLAGIVNDLLALARIEDAREEVELTVIDAAAAAGAAVAALRERTDEKNVEIRLELAPTPVWANASLLTQVFRNLLENACRYSPRNGVVRVTSRNEGEKILFCVSDSGPGIPAEALPRVFERFYQVKKERNSGTAGIGLAVCKHIIERHNGRIWAESPHNGAATAMLFTLRSAAPVQSFVVSTAQSKRG